MKREDKGAENNSSKTTVSIYQTMKKAKTVTEASFKVVHILMKNKKPFTNGGIVKEALTMVAETLFMDFKINAEILSAIADVQILCQGESIKESFIDPDNYTNL